MMKDFQSLTEDYGTKKSIAKKLGKYFIVFAFLVIAVGMFLDLSYNMNLGYIQARISWLVVSLSLVLPIIYIVYSGNRKKRAIVSATVAMIYTLFGLFPQSTFLQLVAIPIVGGYDEDYMYMGSMLDGFHFFEYGFTGIKYTFFVGAGIGIIVLIMQIKGNRNQKPEERVLKGCGSSVGLAELARLETDNKSRGAEY